MIKMKLDRHSTVYDCCHAANERTDMKGTLNLISKLLTNERKDILAENTGSVSGTHANQIICSTPPRRLLRGEEEVQRVSWGPTTKKNITPCRGRAVNDDHKRREAACDGRVLIYRVSNPNEPKKDIRQPCRCCKSNTAFYCTGCKNWLCAGNQVMTDAKIKAIQREHPQHQKNH